MKNRMVCIGSCVVCLALFGCASEQRRFTGFLRDYSVLKPDPTIQGALVYWNPEIDSKSYKAVMVEPVVVHFMRQQEKDRASPEDVVAFRRFVTDELTAAISKYAAIATEPGPRVLRCRLQVANLQFTRPTHAPRYPWERPEYALGAADIEIDACDSISGELVAAYVSPRGRAELSTTFFLTSPPNPWESAKTIVRNRVVTWTDLEARHCVSGVSGTDVSYATLLPTTAGTSSVTTPTAFMNKVNTIQERDPCPGK